GGSGGSPGGAWAPNLRTYVPVTAQASPRARFRRAIERRALWLGEGAMRGMGQITLDEGGKLGHLDREAGSPKYEKAALRWLGRYLEEEQPSLEHFATVARTLAELGSPEPDSYLVERREPEED